MKFWMVSAALAPMLASPLAAQTGAPTTTPATIATNLSQTPAHPPEVATTPLSFDLNAVPQAETLPPPLDPDARPRTVRSNEVAPQPSTIPEGGYSRTLRNQSVAAATPQETNGQRCERTPSGGTRCTTVLLQSNSVEGQRVAAELDEQSARLEAQVQRELDRLSNPPPR